MLVAQNNRSVSKFRNSEVNAGNYAINLSTFSTFNFIYYLTKAKIQNRRFPQIALASRGGKRQERRVYITAFQICTKFEENNRKVALKY